MTRTIGFRCGTAVGAMALSIAYAGAAGAQDRPATASPSKETPADTRAATTTTPDAKDIIVTGYRASLKSAADIKRTSDSILDAVVAEDIGKLPNNTAAETIARMPGVQVDRSLDEVTGVLIRGLPDVTTTYNGRDIYTTDGRGVNLTDFPAGALSGIEVYKSGTADLLEPGLSGLVNVRSSKPFDFKGFTIGGGYRGIYGDRSHKIDSNYNMLVSGRTQTGIGEIGVLAQIAVPVAHPYVSYRYNGYNQVMPQAGQVVSPTSVGRSFYFPDFVGLQYSQGKRSRPGANIAVQWRPAHNLELYGDMLYQSFRGRYVTDSFGASLTENKPSLTNVVLDPNQPNAAQSLTKVGGWRPDLSRAIETGNLDGFQYGGGAIWTTGRARLSTDIAYTTSRYYDVYMNIDQAMIGSINGIAAPTMEIDFNKAKGPSFGFPGFNSTDPANYVVRGIWESRYTAKGSGWQWRADLDLDVDLPFIKKLQSGVRFTTRDVASNWTGRYAYLWQLQDPLSALPVDYEKTAGRFRDPGVMPFNQWLAPTRASVLDNRAAILTYTRQALQRLNAITPGSQTNAIAAFAPDLAAFNPLNRYTASEESYTFYNQAKYGFGLGAIDVDGMVGIRVVNTVGHYNGTEGINPPNGQGPRTLVTNRLNDLDILPNASIRFRFSPQLQLRLAATKTRTRPSFGQLSPSTTIAINDQQSQLASGFAASGSAGNPNLRSLTSKNYDASLEAYFGKTGAASIAIFYHDIFGFIGNYSRPVEHPVLGRILLSKPENAGSGKIKGIELAFQSAFDFLPGALSGLGVQLNGTYVDARTQQPAMFGVNRPLIQIAGVSKWAGNATLFYEYGKISTRVAYNIRSRFVQSYDTVLDTKALAGDFTDPVSRLDFSFGYSPVKSITLSLDASNLLARPFTNYNAPRGPTFRRDVRDESRFIALGARFRF